MNRLRQNGMSCVMALAAVVVVLAPTASAGFTSVGAFYSVSSSVGGGNLINTAMDTTPVSWVNNGNWTAPSASIEWSNNLQVWNQATGIGMVNVNIVIRNNTAAAQDFTLVAGMDGFASGPFTASGSIGGQYVNGSATLGMLTSSGPLWSAIADSSIVNTQLNNALFFAQPFQVVSLGSFSFSNIQFGGGISDRASIAFSMRLSPGGEASFTSVFSFQVIPAPAAFALIGLMPLVRSRRRR
ncbi:MAG: hypothetical protein EXS15_02850 [Phycisphaerales bacterium]|nr:hypothetical protein [Phycisphaerales bacterium]